MRATDSEVFFAISMRELLIVSAFDEAALVLLIIVLRLEIAVLKCFARTPISSFDFSLRLTVRSRFPMRSVIRTILSSFFKEWHYKQQKKYQDNSQN